MKRLIFGLICILFVRNTWAQFWIKDTINMNPGFTTQVYYDVKEGVKGTAPIANYDIAHSSDARDNTVRINHMNQWKVYVYRKGNTSAWNTVDTTGMYMWPAVHNDPTNHSVGAFRHYCANGSTTCFQWGNYDFATNIITGDSLFIIKNNTSTYKVWFIKQVLGALYFKYANINGSNEVTDTLKASENQGQNYKFYTFGTKAKPKREPDNKTWEISFSRYYDQVQGIFYPVMGVENCRGVLTAKIYPSKVSTLNLSLTNGCNFINSNKGKLSNRMDNIGANWKFFNGATYDIADTIGYMVRRIRSATDTSYWFLYFTGFTGSSSGKTYLSKTQISCLGSVAKPNIGKLSVFPNPLKGKDLIVNFESQNARITKIELIGLDGKIIYSQLTETDLGMSSFTIPCSNLSSGYYLTKITTTKGVISQKVAVH